MGGTSKSSEPVSTGTLNVIENSDIVVGTFVAPFKGLVLTTEGPVWAKASKEITKRLAILRRKIREITDRIKHFISPLLGVSQSIFLQNPRLSWVNPSFPLHSIPKGYNERGQISSPVIISTY